MGIEDEIRSYLASGYNPQQIIRQFGYKKSTVYKVHNEQKMGTALVMPISWSIQDTSFDRGPDSRYLPGEIATVSFNLINQSSCDLYIVSMGVQPEWLQMYLGYGQSEWLTQPGTLMLHPNDKRAYKFRVEIPDGYQVVRSSGRPVCSTGAAPQRPASE